MKLLRLRGRKVNDRLLRKGNVWKGKTMTVRWLRGKPFKRTEEGAYIGTYASRKLHASAVKRNRMRRRCREALRLALKDRHDVPVVQMLLNPRIQSLTCNFEEIQSDVAHFLDVL